MKKIVAFLSLLGAVLLLSLPALGMPKGPARINFAAQSAGPVDFSHELHKGYVPQCETCHHMGVGTGTCTDCHGADSRARGKNQAFHQSCQGCHQALNVSDSRDCQFCHGQSEDPSPTEPVSGRGQGKIKN